MHSSKHLWFAGAAAGSMVVAMSGQALGQDINDKVTGPSSGVTAAGTGTQNVTVTITATGNVDNPSGIGVDATAQQGNVTVIDHGVVSGSAGGILGETLGSANNPAGPSVTITVTGPVTGGSADAIEALTVGAGPASIHVGGGSASSPETISTSGPAGVAAVSVFGNASATLGANVSISAGAAGESGVADIAAIGIFTPADTSGPSALVTVGQNATLDLLGNRSAAVAGEIGQSGIQGPTNGTASASVTVGDGVDISVHGFSDAGVIGYVTDLTPAHLYSGSGDVSVSVGTGSITIDEVGAIGASGGAMTNLGVGAISAGGNVSVTNAANVTVSGGLDISTGLEAQTSGAGSASVTNRGSITSNNGNGIVATAASGLASVDFTAGAIAASGIGIDATSSSGGVNVSAGKSTSITAGGAGINAVGGGAVVVDSEGSISAGAGGVFAQSSNGSVAVTIGGNVATTGTADAVEAIDFSASPASIKIGSGSSASDPLTISTTGPGGASAISVFGDASVTLGNNVSVTAGAPGEAASADVAAIAIATGADTGGPSASITLGRNDTLNLDGDGSAAIAAEIGQPGQEGPANGTASASITVGNGVAIDVHGFSDAGVIGSVTDYTPAHLFTGLGDVTLTVGTGSINLDEVGGVGAPGVSMTNAGEAAISGGGNVSVTNAANITVSGGIDISVGIEAETAGAGAASVTDSGSITSNNGAALFASTSAGDAGVNVTGGEIVASGTGIDATSSSGNITVTTAKSVSIATGGAGIIAITGGVGSVTVTSAGGVVSTAADGIDATAASGQATVTVTGGGIVAAGIGVDATAASGAVNVTTGKATTIVAGGAGIQAEAGSVVVDSEGSVAGGGNAAFIGTGSGDGILAEAVAGSAAVTVNGNVSTAGGADAVLAISVGAPPDTATITVGSGTQAHPLTLGGGEFGGAVAISELGAANVTVGDNVSVSVGAPGLAGITDIGALGIQAAAPILGGTDASVVVGQNAALTLAGNRAAAVTAQLGSTSAADATASVGNGVAINVSGLDDAGVIAFVTDISPAQAFIGLGDASVSVGTGSINVGETGAIGPAPGLAVNIGEGAFSGEGNVSINNAANIVVTGVLDTTNGLEAETGGNGSSTITTSGNITVDNGDGIKAQTQDGVATIDVVGGQVTGTVDAVLALVGGDGSASITIGRPATLFGAAGAEVGGGASLVSIDNAGAINGGAEGGVAVSASPTATVSVTNEASGTILGLVGVELESDGASSVDNRGFIGTQMTDHTGVAIFDRGPDALTIINEAGATLDGVIDAPAGNVTFDNAGLWQTASASQFGGSSVLNNTGLIQVGEGGAAGAPATASFIDLGAFNNGSASATGVISMVNKHVGDALVISGLFTGAPGHSFLQLDVQLGGPGSQADELILRGGSAGQTLIDVNDVLHGHAALNPGGIVLVQGSSAASTFALDPTQPGYDPATQGIDKGLFTYPLVFSGGEELLVGEPGLSARQLATMGAAAEDVWSSTSPGDQSETHLAASLASGGGDETGGLRVWAQAVNGGPSRLNGGQTMLGRASFADDPSAGGGPPLAGVVQQTSSVSAYGMTYGFNTGYAQNVSALLSGVDLGRRVGDQDAWSWGVSTGYLESQQSFTAGSSVAQYQGALAAVHGAYVNANGFHVAGDVKVTALQVSYLTAWGGGGASTPNAAIDTFGGEADAGWTRGIGGGWTLEPVASLSLQSSKLGALMIAGTDVRFGDASSARLGFGAKLSGGGKLFGLTWKSQSTLQMWDELHSANTLELTSVGAGSVLPDPIGGIFTDASESLSLQSADGRASAFVTGAYRWKPDYQAAQLSMGVKLAW